MRCIWRQWLQFELLAPKDLLQAGLNIDGFFFGMGTRFACPRSGSPEQIEAVRPSDLHVDALTNDRDGLSAKNDY
jgi:hypothetical protein